MDRRVPVWSQSKDVTVTDTIKQMDALPGQAIMKFRNSHLPRLEHLGPSLVIVGKKIGVMRFRYRLYKCFVLHTATNS